MKEDVIKALAEALEMDTADIKPEADFWRLDASLSSRGGV